MKSFEHTISSDTIADFRATAEPILDASPQMNESNTKVKLVQPFLQDVLGWEIHDMELEYSVQMGGQTYHVDYALTVADIPKVFVEAKGCDITLKDEHVDQLQSYLKLQDVSWGLLTNGTEYRLYQLAVQGGETDFHCIAAASIDELDRYRQELSAVSKPAIESGNAVDVVRHIRELQKAEQALATRKSEIAASVAESITAETTDVIYQEAEREAKELVDRLGQRLRSDRDDTPSDSGPQPADGPEPTDPLPEVDPAEIDGDDDAHTAVYASDESGIDFLRKYEAWGFISIASQPEYFLLYLTRPHQEVRFLGVVEDVVDADTFVSARGIPTDEYRYEDGKKVVVFSELYELESPIPLGDIPHRMQGLLYTTLGEVRAAASTDDL